VKKQACASQLPADQSVPRLIDVARTHSTPSSASRRCSGWGGEGPARAGVLRVGLITRNQITPNAGCRRAMRIPDCWPNSELPAMARWKIPVRLFQFQAPVIRRFASADAATLASCG
jgi:hypothetical protein